jgi:hypothetical protein
MTVCAPIWSLSHLPPERKFCFTPSQASFNLSPSCSTVTTVIKQAARGTWPLRGQMLGVHPRPVRCVCWSISSLMMRLQLFCCLWSFKVSTTATTSHGQEGAYIIIMLTQTFQKASLLLNYSASVAINHLTFLTPYQFDQYCTNEQLLTTVSWPRLRNKSKRVWGFVSPVAAPPAAVTAVITVVPPS